MTIQKIFTVATTEFGTAVRSKSFLIGLLLLPIIVGASIFLQKFMADQVDTTPRNFAVIDRTGKLYPVIAAAADANNQNLNDDEGKQRRPAFQPTEVKPPASKDEAQTTLLDLSDQVRSGKLFAFVELPDNLMEPMGGAIQYYSNTPNDSTLRDWLNNIVSTQVRTIRFSGSGIDQQLATRLNSPVPTENLGLLDRDTSAITSSSTGAGGRIKAAEKIDPIRTFAVPAVLLFVMFFVIMSSAPHLLNSVLEEKMSRVSEVLLGSVTPFELMMGKLLGNVGIASLLAMLYVGGGYAVASYFGYADVITPSLLALLALFLVLAVLLYGSLYMAVGAACSELKDAQSLMMPVMLISMLPMFVWTAVIQNPASPISVGMSLFPPATPFLMMMRMALKPSPPFWQVALGIGLTLATTVACVWAGGKIFRTGLLMHGKAPTFRELARWVVAR